MPRSRSLSSRDCGVLSNRPALRMWYVARSPMSRFCCRCLVLLLLVAVATGCSARPLEAGTRPFADIVDAAARRHGVDPSLVHAIIAVESGYRANAQSPAGAQGLMQLMPGTQRQLGVSDAFDPQQNVDAGVAYLHRLTDEFGTVLALAAYNAGPGAVRRYNGIPPYKETRAYVQAVLDRAQPVADVQALEEQVSSEDRADAAAEADVAEGDPGGRLQDDHLAADAGREPHALSEAWDLDGRVRTARLVRHHVADRLPADAAVRCEGPGLPVVAATQAQRPRARRRTDHRFPSSKELRAPTSGSEQRAPVGSSPSVDRGADSPPRGPTATTPAAHKVGLLRVRPPPGLLALENPRRRS
ncbi:MAG: lytic transglycosylase domain-containing protein [Acidobacteria bacterium]|nr:lytic transglycosylase domain-containing protein [Acidobacteriota bacterium]